MFLSMNNSNYMSNSNRFKDIGTFLSKKSLMRSHMTRNALDDPKIMTEQCNVLLMIFLEFFGPNQKSLSLKMAEIWPIL